MTFPVFASGDVLNASDMNAVGLWLVKTQTIGTAVSSITVSNAFSADYDNYRVTISGGAGSTTGGLSLRVGAAATGYAYVLFQNNYNGTAANDNATNATSYAIAGGFSTNSLSLNVDILSPFLTENTMFFSNRAIPDTASVAGAGAGFLNNTTSYTDLTILTSTGTVTGGTIRVYGYRN